MRPPWSMVIFTVLAGAGQGLLVMLILEQWGSFSNQAPATTSNAFLGPSLLAFGLLFAGLISAFFHLGRPSRAWRSASQWRTSWLSREIIVMPVVLGLAFVHGLQGVLELPAYFGPLWAVVAPLALLACLAMWICTAMIYGCLKFLQEWATPWTPVAFILFGLTGGALFFGLSRSVLPVEGLVVSKPLIGLLLLVSLTVKALVFKRNAELRPKSTLSSATGIPGNVRQVTMGIMGGSFNTREFFHGVSHGLMRQLRPTVLMLAFVLPLVMLFVLPLTAFTAALIALVHLLGMLAERWLFFAQANHPQNLYYQRIA
ncbi:MAG: dimethyl sulfoxide reductase anchor subunit family protein [Burkholderiaceae bacterium]